MKKSFTIHDLPISERLRGTATKTWQKVEELTEEAKREVENLINN